MKTERRVFLTRLGGLIAVGSVPSAWIAACGPPSAGSNSDPSADRWRTLSAVQAHLFPAEPGAPGAAQIQALGYLRATLEIPSFDAAERSAVLDGAGEIERLAQTQVGRSFAELAEPEREAVLRAYEATDAGRRWLAGILGYLLEALLGAPAYGGNPDGIGWRWLEHNPGFPLPTPAKRYYLL